MGKGDATEAPREMSCGTFLPGQWAQLGTQHLRVPMPLAPSVRGLALAKVPVLFSRDMWT